MCFPCSQWEDPGTTPFEDESGGRYWLNPSGDKITENKEAMMQYVWIEQYSEELKR